MRRGNNSSGRGRHRRLYNQTGIPGWILFGQSPGFGRDGMGPCAEYLQKTGQMDNFVKEITKDNANFAALQKSFQDSSIPDPEITKQLIKDRMAQLENELRSLKEELKNIK
ncbi:MAG: hypothetical protein ACTSO7_13605 [Candidatus Heimdallarchaeota archaeon]